MKCRSFFTIPIVLTGITIAIPTIAQGNAGAVTSATEEKIGCVLVTKAKDADPLNIFSKVVTVDTCKKYFEAKEKVESEKDQNQQIIMKTRIVDFEKDSDDRLILEKNQKITVKGMGDHLCGTKITFNEKNRKSTIEKDGDLLVKIISKVLAAKDLCVLPNESYVLKNKRSELEISLAKPAPLITPASPKSDEISEKDEVKFSLTTGPTEHFFLSADIVVNSIDELKYDPATNTLTEKDKPTTYYLGLNYMIGDVLKSYNDPAFERIFLKAMFQLDQHPTDSYGIGIGYRPEFIESVSFYAAYMYFKEDKLEDGKLQENKGKGEEVVIGVSFNLDKALGWLTN